MKTGSRAKKRLTKLPILEDTDNLRAEMAKEFHRLMGDNGRLVQAVRDLEISRIDLIVENSRLRDLLRTRLRKPKGG